MGMVMEGTALADSKEYQNRLAGARRKGLPAAVQQQPRQQVRQFRERSRELKQEMKPPQQKFPQQGAAYTAKIESSI